VYTHSSKIAFYAPRRFWEEDDDIYGGMSWTSRDIVQILYPSHGIRKPDGVLVGSYSFGFAPDDDMTKFPVAERIAKAIASGEKIHPGYSKLVQQGISVAWPHVPHNMGAWAEWTPKQKETIFRTLLKPDGAIYFAGEHTANLSSWQEGAILSAHYAIDAIAARLRA
jgi:monoamine oxidase